MTVVIVCIPLCQAKLDEIYLISDSDSELILFRDGRAIKRMRVFMPPSVKTPKSSFRKLKIKNEPKNNPCDFVLRGGATQSPLLR